jgi:hypothetical protein
VGRADERRVVARLQGQFTKPIAHELVVNLDMLAMNPRNAEHLELLGLLAKEGWQKAQLGDYHSQKQALSRFTLSALLLSTPVLASSFRSCRSEKLACRRPADGSAA